MTPPPRSWMPARLFWPATLGVIGFFCIGLFAAYVILIFASRPMGEGTVAILMGIAVVPGSVALLVADQARRAWRRHAARTATVLALLPVAVLALIIGWILS